MRRGAGSNGKQEAELIRLKGALRAGVLHLSKRGSAGPVRRIENSVPRQIAKGSGDGDDEHGARGRAGVESIERKEDR